MGRIKLIFHDLQCLQKMDSQKALLYSNFLVPTPAQKMTVNLSLIIIMSGTYERVSFWLHRWSLLRSHKVVAIRVGENAVVKHFREKMEWIILSLDQCSYAAHQIPSKSAKNFFSLSNWVTSRFYFLVSPYSVILCLFLTVIVLCYTFYSPSLWGLVFWFWGCLASFKFIFQVLMSGLLFFYGFIACILFLFDFVFWGTGVCFVSCVHDRHIDFFSSQWLDHDLLHCGTSFNQPSRVTIHKMFPTWENFISERSKSCWQVLKRWWSRRCPIKNNNKQKTISVCRVGHHDNPT